MKNFIFKSSESKDLLKIFSTLEIIQKEQRANRYDNQKELAFLETIVKGLALLVSAPEPDNDYQSEPPELEDK